MSDLQCRKFMQGTPNHQWVFMPNVAQADGAVLSRRAAHEIAVV
ncbi:hypothetical protein [Actinomyces israelii]|nr:hypothetical protein [Actinomyces israelii]